MALDADTGKVVWEYKFNIFQSDVPPHRVGWASPAADPETGNIYALERRRPGRSRSSRDGKLLWERSFGEEFAAFTTHGGRTMSPLVDGDLVIVSAAVSNWGTLRQPRASLHRARQADRRDRLRRQPGRPALRHRLRGADHRHDQRHAAAHRRRSATARVHAIKPQTGEKVWSFVAAKRAINTGVVVSGSTVIVSHGDENLDGNELGLIAAHRRLADRRHQDDEVGGARASSSASRRRSSTATARLSDRQRLDAARLRHRRPASELWTQPLGTAQKAPPVLADGKIYVGTENGKFFIVRPRADRAEILSEVELPISTNSCCGVGGHAGAGARRRGRLARPRLLRLERRGLCDRPEGGAKPPTGFAVDEPAVAGRPARRRTCRCRRPSWCSTPGQTVKLRARLFDDKGRFLREEQGDAGRSKA